jgi:hypothetical protein
VDLGHTRTRLVSAYIARRFCYSVGYRDAGPPESWGRLLCYPMEEDIA